MSRRERGYTLIEVLAAVAILTILMSIVIWGIGDYQRRAQMEGSRAVILKVKAGLDAYYNDHRRYPPDGYDTVVKRQIGGSQAAIKGSQSLIYFLGIAQIVEVEQGEDVLRMERKPYVEFTAEMLSGEGELDEKLAGAATEIVDKFGNPIHYDNCELDPQTGRPIVNDQSDRHMSRLDGAEVPAPDPRKPPGSRPGQAGGAVKAKNPGTYDIWSHGLDIAGTADDITNWR